MRPRVYKVLLTSGLLAAALVLAACGSSNSPSTSKAPGNPAESGDTAASGPVLGAWWDSTTSALRTEYGVTGAAREGQASYNNGTYAGAGVCMRQRIALLTTSSGALFLASVPQGTPAEVASQGIAKGQVVFSPTCNAALEYAPGKSSALLIEGLPSAARVSTVGLPAGVTAAAVADSGSILVDVRQADGAAAIELVASGSNTVRPVTVLSQFGGMALLPGADSALLADTGASTVVEATQMSGNVSLTQVAGTADGIGQPIAVAVSDDGHFAAVANRSSSSVVRIDLSGESAATHAVCRCAPTELQALAGNLAFRVNEAGAGTVWAFDGDAATPRFVFLPTNQSATQGAHQ